MSIKTEIQRIQTAKSDLKASIESRGGVVNDSVTIDNYNEILNSRPYAIKGTFTPEADTRHFSISGLPFKPNTIYIFSPELDGLVVTNSILVFAKGNDMVGVAGYTNASNEYTIINIKKDTSVESWTNDGYEVNFPSSFGAFKAGYTYDYYIAGGFAE